MPQRIVGTHWGIFCPNFSLTWGFGTNDHVGTNIFRETSFSSSLSMCQRRSNEHDEWWATDEVFNKCIYTSVIPSFI